MRRPLLPASSIGTALALAAALALGERASAALGHPLGSITAAATDATDDLREGAAARRAHGAPGRRGAAPPLAGLRGLDGADGGEPSAARYASHTRAAGWVARDSDEAGWLLELEAPGTYMEELLLRADSALTRWPVRTGRPVTYWVQSGAGLDEWTPAHVRQVRAAFDAWQDTGIPVHFTPTTDSARADILVVWTPQFREPISGKTRWIHDRRGWIRSAQVTLALRRFTGEVLEEDAVHAIALHEIGHALGMDHTSDASNVMAPRVRVRELSAADRATVQLLYRLPPGSLRR